MFKDVQMVADGHVDFYLASKSQAMNNLSVPHFLLMFIFNNTGIAKASQSDLRRSTQMGNLQMDVHILVP